MRPDVDAAIPLIRAAPLQAAAEFLEREGAPVERLLARAKLTPVALEDPESLVPFAAVTRFMEEAAHREGLEDFGLRLGQHSRAQQMGHFGRLLGQSLTLRHGLQTLGRIWSSFTSSMRSWVTLEPDRVQLHFAFLHGTEDSWGQFATAALLHHLHFVGSVAGPGWRPIAVQVPMSNLPGCRAIPELSDARIEFGQPAATISFSPALLCHPLPRMPATRVAMDREAWEHAKPADDVGGAVRQIVTTMLRDGYPDVHALAEAVGMSARTLQRRLQDEGLTYAGVIAQARFDAAQRLLDDPARKVIDVALDLGYSDPSHFTRAFERWAGVAPREFRRLRSVDHAEPSLPQGTRRA